MKGSIVWKLRLLREAYRQGSISTQRAWKWAKIISHNSNVENAHDICFGFIVR